MVDTWEEKRVDAIWITMAATFIDSTNTVEFTTSINSSSVATCPPQRQTRLRVNL